MGELVTFSPDFFLVRMAVFALLMGYHKRLFWDHGFIRDGQSDGALPYFLSMKIRTNLSPSTIDKIGYLEFNLLEVGYWSHWFQERSVFLARGKFRDGDDFLNVTAPIKQENLAKLQYDLSNGDFSGFENKELIERLMLPGN